MNEQSHSAAYGAALDAAMEELDSICQERAYLRSRTDRLESVVKVLEPLMGSSQQISIDVRHSEYKSIEPSAEPVPSDEPIHQTVAFELPKIVPLRASESTDPIQRRIDSILGLAVA